MSALWTSSELASATGGTAQGQWSVNGISIDTRTLAKNDLFVALKGDNRDGHAFVADALSKGAGAALVSEIPSNVSAGAPLLIVDDTLDALAAAGRAARARTRARILAVTGSAGKTTTKEMLRLVLGHEGRVSASVASYNNHWGVPLSLTRMERDTDSGVFEIGMNHEGEIRALVAQVKPEVAIITTIAPAHLEYFGTLEKIADAKAEIFEGLVPGGIAILPRDNPQFARLEAHARAAGVASILTFGTTEGADARLLATEPKGEGQSVSADVKGQKIAFTIGAPGAHIASNAMAVLLAADAVGVPLAKAAASLAGFEALKGRGACIALGDIDLIDESYNANPASLSAALGLLKAARPKANGRRIAVLGDMLELGADAGVLHRAIADDSSAPAVDLFFLSGPLMRGLWDALPATQRGAYAVQSSGLSPELLSRLTPGDVVLVKGSNGSRMSVIIEALKARHATMAD
jgi:UDP-N-acetylmuramoyl-tripeptide--D-alanyl-D-alanine ligase